MITGRRRTRCIDINEMGVTETSAPHREPAIRPAWKLRLDPVRACAAGAHREDPDRITRQPVDEDAGQCGLGVWVRCVDRAAGCQLSAKRNSAMTARVAGTDLVPPRVSAIRRGSPGSWLTGGIGIGIGSGSCLSPMAAIRQSNCDCSISDQEAVAAGVRNWPVDGELTVTLRAHDAQSHLSGPSQPTSWHRFQVLGPAMTRANYRTYPCRLHQHSAQKLLSRPRSWSR